MWNACGRWTRGLTSAATSTMALLCESMDERVAAGAGAADPDDAGRNALRALDQQIAADRPLGLNPTERQQLAVVEDRGANSRSCVVLAASGA